MLVSIVVPCYNQAYLIDETLTSIAAQTFQDWECIIVNDGGTDNIREVVARWTSRDTRFSLYEKENGGLSSARNEGLKYAKGTFVLPLDADDKISTSYLESAVDAFEKNPDVVLVYGRAEYFDAKDGEWLLPEFTYEKLLLQNQIYCSAIFRLKDALAIGGYDEALKSGFEDWEFWMRLLNANARVVKLPKVVFYYRKKQNSMLEMLSKQKNTSQIAEAYIFKKHIDKYLQFYNISMRTIKEAKRYHELKNKFAAFKSPGAYLKKILAGKKTN